MNTHLKVILLLLITLGLIVAYGLSDITLLSDDCEFDKANMQSVKEWWYAQKTLFSGQTSAEKPDKMGKKTSSKSKESHENDTVTPAQPTATPIDTAKQRILFFGDSMIEGLSRKMSDYAVENGHHCQSVCWYNSTTKTWSQTDTLAHFIRSFKPTFVAICLCSNELFVNDVETKRKQYIANIISTIGSVPYVWISPPSWRRDTGINAAIQEAVGPKRYFDSARLSFRRGKDKVHPVYSSSAQWMDSIAHWMGSQQTAHPIVMKAPHRVATKRQKDSLCITTYLMPYRK